MYKRGIATALLLASMAGCSKAPPSLSSGIDQIKGLLGLSGMPSACEEFAHLVIQQAQKNVASAKTPESKRRNQAVLDSLNHALAEEAGQKPPKKYDRAQCKTAVDNWKAVAADGPNDALSAERITQSDPAAQAAAAASEAAAAALAAAADAQKAVADISAASAADATAQADITSTTPASSQQVATAASDSTAQAPVTRVAATTAPSLDAGCSDSVGCAKAMLNFAKSENLAGALQAANAIDALPRPPRGDRAAARELNRLALAAISASKPGDAVKLLEEAHRKDPGDEEVISNLAFAYSLDGQLAKSEDTAVVALSLNPRRTSIWAPLAVTLAKENRMDQAVEAMWLAFQFSNDKQKTLDFIDTRLGAESDPAVKTMYGRCKAWFTQNQKPSFNS